MCFGSKSSSNTTPPAPQPPTTFDYSAGQRAQMNADGKIGQAQAAKQISSTGGPAPMDQAKWGSELSGSGGV